MGKYSGYLLLSDMDGTLLDSDGSVSADNRKAISEFVDGGGLFTIATGRTHYAAWPHVHDIGINCPAILLNGGSIYDFSKEKQLYAKKLQRSDVDAFIPLLQAAFPSVAVLVFEEENVAILSGIEILWEVPEPERAHFYPACLADMVENPQKIVILCEKKDAGNLSEFMKDHADIKNTEMVQSAEACYELLPKNVSKGQALKWLGRHLGIEKEKILAIGDYGNDTEMIRFAGIGGAPSNAHPEVLAEADYIVCHHTESAIADFIRQVF